MKLYRYEDRVYSTVSVSVSGGESYGTTPVQLALLTYEVLRETPSGYWIKHGFDKRWVKRNGPAAKTTIAEALKDFLRRKRYQLRIFKARIARVEDAIRLAEKVIPVEEEEALKLAGQVAEKLA